MKRCPQCEFIYEDDQNVCDMDGEVLVFDSRTLPNLSALETESASPKASHRRNRATPAFATVVSALVLGMVFYVSTRRSSYQPTIPASTLSVAPVPAPTPEPQPSPQPSPVKEPIKEEAKQSTVAPVNKGTTKAATVSQTKRTNKSKKDDSKVNSILKKTGRILKKPFKKL
jgi:hypothetical protein